MAKTKKPKRKKYQRSQIKLPEEGVIYDDSGPIKISEDFQGKQARMTEIKTGAKYSFFWHLIFFCIGCFIGLIILGFFLLFSFEKKYSGRIYPGIKVSGVNFGGRKKEDIKNYFNSQDSKFHNLTITFVYNQPVATISSEELKIGYNSKLLADQAFLLGRSGNIFSDLSIKLTSWKNPIDLPSSLTMNDTALDKLLSNLSKSINLAPADALFQFQNGRVAAFRTSKNGRQLDQTATKERFYQTLNSLNNNPRFPQKISFPLTVVVVKPKVTTEAANKFGIKDLLGTGNSIFYHSIENRVFNVALAASRINGTLIAPQETFSFNKTLGDVSAFTGYKQAYIIKEGHTILGDGGGVCQVSTTLFRASLNAGLPIVERWPHSYRVGYYEQNSPPGIDATVYDPSNDLKILNDTGHYILVQTVIDSQNYSLTFLLYGQSDGRKATLTKPVLWDETPPPSDLYQDDPTLPKGKINQVDFAAWGVKASFDYRVERNGQTIFQKTFFSNYQPWQAIFTRGTKE